MGYTNYYYTPVKMDAVKFKKLSEELQTVSGLLPKVDDKTIILCNGIGVNNPEFSKKDIRFNGNEKEGLDHETFSLSQDSTKQANACGSKNDLVFNFCKTNEKPYDFMVKLSLLRLKYYFPECDIHSDGSSKDWKLARVFYKKVFGEAAPKVDR
jgi:hypothetical protein